jgi:tripartite-type tricarboxylate transporter receptor subunit TctC
MITRRNFALTLAALPFGLAKIGAAQAQAYPTKPIRFVVPFPAGGSTDVGARLIAESLSRSFGQQVYVKPCAPVVGEVGRRLIA